MNISTWQQTQTVTLEAVNGDTVQEYRLTFKTCNNFDIALFNRRRAGIFAELSEKYGDEFTDSDEAMALLTTQVSHAIVLAGLKMVEVKNGDKWEETKLPDAWYDLERFPYEAPAGVLTPLTDAVFAAGNAPRLFSYLPADDAEKKILRINVQS